MAETWDEAKPAGSRDPKLGDDDIREFKRAIRERLAEDHWFSATENPAYGAGGGYAIGKHKFLTLKQYNTAKTTLSDEISFRCKDVSGSKEVIMTPPSAGTDRQITKNGGQNLAIVAGDLTAGIITEGYIGTGAVTNAKLGADCVTAAKIGDDQVNSSHLANNSVLTAMIADGNVTPAKIQSSSITATQMANDAITPAKTSHGFVPVLTMPYPLREFEQAGPDWVAQFVIKVKMPSGPTAINGICNIHSNNGSVNGYCRIGIGSTYSGTAQRANLTYSWVAFPSSLNCSALTPGTTYTLTVYLNAATSSAYRGYLDGICLWWE